ncbi:MAG TPA: ISAs1 family transposase [Ktedonobacterales bacterium]
MRQKTKTALPPAATATVEEELAEEKAQAELSVTPDLLRQVRLRGRLVTGDALYCLVTGDALYCQHTLWAQIRRAKGHYLFVIKLNQPELLEEVALLFDQSPPGERFTTASSYRTQRDRHEVRTLTAAAALADYLAELGGAGARQVVRLESCVTHVGGARAGQTTRLVRYFLTSLGPHVPAHRLLRLVREHWHIENRLHYVRDVTLGEDASQVRCAPARLPKRSLPCVMPCWACCVSTATTAWRPRCAISRGHLAPPSGSSASILHNEETLGCSASTIGIRGLAAAGRVLDDAVTSYTECSPRRP